MTDRDDIVQALARVAAAIDARDWGTIRAHFTADTVAYGAHGIDELIGRLEGHLGGVGPTQHLVGNHRVTVDGDTARSLTYGRIHHVGAGPMDGSSYECMGEYDDEWVRTAAGWRICRRWFEIRIEIGDVAVLRPAE